jgi:hypothetical protein
MRRSFRVATVFTGVAAVAGGFGPTALAATAKTTAIPATPTNQICGANDDGVSHWLHLFYPNDDHPAECFHGTGTVAATGTIHSFCPGSASGYISGHSTTFGNPYASPFNARTSRTGFYTRYGSATNLNISEVTITRFVDVGFQCT